MLGVGMRVESELGKGTRVNSRAPFDGQLPIARHLDEGCTPCQRISYPDLPGTLDLQRTSTSWSPGGNG
jgi:hypothetical protein